MNKHLIVGISWVCLTATSLGAFWLARDWVEGQRKNAMLVRQRATEIINEEQKSRRQ